MKDRINNDVQQPSNPSFSEHMQKKRLRSEPYHYPFDHSKTPSPPIRRQMDRVVNNRHTTGLWNLPVYHFKGLNGGHEMVKHSMLSGVLGIIRVIMRGQEGTQSSKEKELIRKGFTATTTLKDLRLMIQGPAGRGNQRFFFLYPDGVRVAGKKESELKVLTFGTRVFIQFDENDCNIIGSPNQIPEEEELGFRKGIQSPTRKTRLPVGLLEAPHTQQKSPSSATNVTEACRHRRTLKRRRRSRVVYVSYDDKVQAIAFKALDDVMLLANDMAVIIQCLVRQRAARHRMQRLLEDSNPRSPRNLSAIIIQAPARGFVIRRRRWHQRRCQAATTIQCLVRQRRAKQRVSMKRLERHSGTTLQNIDRIVLAQQVVAELRSYVRAAITIQAVTRGMQGRKRVKGLREEQRLRKEPVAITIQRNIRGHLGRKRARHQKRLIQLHRQRQEEEESALRIECAMAKAEKQMTERRERAAVIIQCLVRRYLTRLLILPKLLIRRKQQQQQQQQQEGVSFELHPFIASTPTAEGQGGPLLSAALLTPLPQQHLADETTRLSGSEDNKEVLEEEKKSGRRRFSLKTLFSRSRSMSQGGREASRELHFQSDQRRTSVEPFHDELQQQEALSLPSASDSLIRVKASDPWVEVCQEAPDSLIEFSKDRRAVEEEEGAPDKVQTNGIAALEEGYSPGKAEMDGSAVVDEEDFPGIVQRGGVIVEEVEDAPDNSQTHRSVIEEESSPGKVQADRIVVEEENSPGKGQTDRIAVVEEEGALGKVLAYRIAVEEVEGGPGKVQSYQQEEDSPCKVQTERIAVEEKDLPGIVQRDRVIVEEENSLGKVQQDQIAIVEEENFPGIVQRYQITVREEDAPVQSDQIAVGEEEDGPVNLRTSTAIRGVHTNGHYVYVFLYEDHESNIIHVHGFIPATTDQFSCVVERATWEAAGYGGGFLNEPSTEKRRWLHEAIFSAVNIVQEKGMTIDLVAMQLQRRKEQPGSRMAQEPVTSPASSPIGVSSGCSRVVPEVNRDASDAKDENEDSLVNLRTSVAIRGVHSDRQHVFVSLYEDHESDVIHVHGFVPATVDQFSCFVERTTWEAAGYGGGSSDELSVEERQRLHDAIFSNVNIQDKEMTISLVVSTPVSLPSTSSDSIPMATKLEGKQCPSSLSTKGSDSQTAAATTAAATCPQSTPTSSRGNEVSLDDDLAPTMSRTAAMMRGIRIDGISLLLSLYENVIENNCRLEAFDAAAVITYHVEVLQEQWEKAGYPISLEAMSIDERKRLYNAIIDGIHISDTLDDGGMNSRSIRLELRAESQEGASAVRRRSAVLIKGIRLENHTYLASMYALSECKGGGKAHDCLTVELFDPTRLEEFSAVISQPIWEEADYGSSLHDMSSEQKKALFNAVLEGVRFCLDASSDRRLSIELHPFSPSTSGEGQEGPLLSTASPTGMPKQESPAEATLLSESEENELALQEGKDGRRKSRKFSLKSLLSRTRSMSQDALSLPPASDSSVSVKNGRTHVEVGPQASDELIDSQTNQEAVDEEEDGPINLRTSTAIRGVTSNGHHVFVSLYEDHEVDNIHVNGFIPAAVDQCSCLVARETWEAVGYGGSLNELTMEERHCLHDAIFRSIHIQGTEMNVNLLARPISAPSTPFVSIPVATELDGKQSPSSVSTKGSDSETTASNMQSNSAVMIKGTKVDGRSLLVSLYEDVVETKYVLHAFDATVAETYYAEVLPNQLKKAGYNTSLADMTLDERRGLYTDIISGIHLTVSNGDAAKESSRSISVELRARRQSRARVESQEQEGGLSMISQRNAVLIKGIRLQGRPYLASLYASLQSEGSGKARDCLTVELFDPTRLEEFSAVISQPIWEEADYGSSLHDMSSEQKKALFNAVLEGVRFCLDASSDRRLSIELHPFSPSTSGEGQEGPLLSIASPTGMPKQESPAEATLLSESEENELALQEGKDGRRKSRKFSLKSLLSRTRSMSQDALSLPPASDSSVSVKGNSPYDEVTQETSDELIDSQTNQEAVDKEEEAPVLRTSVAVQAVSSNGHFAYVSLYEDHELDVIHVNGFIPATVDQCSCLINRDTWETAGYGGGPLRGLSMEERHCLHDAIFRCIHIQGTETTVNLASTPALLASTSPGLVPMATELDGKQSPSSVSTKGSDTETTAETTAASTRRQSRPSRASVAGSETSNDDLASTISGTAVLVKGIRIDGRTLLVSLYEDLIENKSLVHAFDPAAVDTYYTELLSEQWEKAGYSTSLTQMSPDQKRRLYTAIIDGIKLTTVDDGEMSSRSIRVDLEAESQEGGLPAVSHRSAVLIKGIRLEDHPYLASLYVCLQNEENGRAHDCLRVELFHPTHLEEFSTLIPQLVWEKAGYGTFLKDMSSGQKRVLFNAALEGVRFGLDGSSTPRMSIELHPFIASTSTEGQEGPLLSTASPTGMPQQEPTAETISALGLEGNREVLEEEKKVGRRRSRNFSLRSLFTRDKSTDDDGHEARKQQESQSRRRSVESPHEDRPLQQGSLLPWVDLL